MRKVVENGKSFMWQTSNGLNNHGNEWLLRRFRMYIWKQWKKARAKVMNLKKLGISYGQACQWGNTRLGYSRISASPVLTRSITNEKLAKAGYYDFPAQYEQLRLLHSNV